MRKEKYNNMEGIAKRRKSPKEQLKRFLLYTMLMGIALTCLFPLYWLIRSSFMSSEEIFGRLTTHWLPEKLLWDNFYFALTTQPFGRYFLNTVFLVGMNLLGNLLSSSWSAFGFARIDFKGRSFWFACVLLTMMIPGTVLLIPQFIMWNQMGFYDTYVPLIAPAFLLNGFNIFLLRQFFQGIPQTYDEAARLDGAGYIQIYARILLPLSKPAMMTIGVFTFMGTWNDFMSPLIYLKTKLKYNLSLGLQAFLGEYVSQWNYLMAASTVVILPMIIVFFFAQKYFIEGITFSGLKG